MDRFRWSGQGDARLITRDNLLGSLDRAATGKVTIISAPAGSGKSSLRWRHRAPVVTAQAPVLAPDLVARSRRLKLAAMRQLAPELLLTAKTQRWAPEELLRTWSRPKSAPGTPPTPAPA